MIFHPKHKVIPPVEFFFDNNDPGCTNVNPDLIHKLEIITNNSSTPAFKMLGTLMKIYLSRKNNYCKNI